MSEGGGRGGGGRGRRFSRGLGHITYTYTPAVMSKIWSKLISAKLCVILRTPVSRACVGACYTRGTRSRRWCGWWGRRRRWGEGGREGWTSAEAWMALER